MKKLTAIISCALALAASAQLRFDYHHGERSTDLIPTNTPAILSAMLGAESAALLHALHLQMAKYDLDMRTRSGRMAWHGRYIGEEIDTNTLEKVEIYSNTVNGAVWRYKEPFKIPASRLASATKRVYRAQTNGIPARLAAARLQAAADLNHGPIITNITINAEAQQ